MTLPSKKVIGIALACIVVVGGAIVLKERQMTAGNGSLELVQNGPTAPILKQTVFYQQSIGTSTATSLTDNMSRDFFLNFVDLQNKGNWNVDSQAALIENITSTYATTSAPILSVRDIAVFSDRDSAKVRIFGNTSAQTIAKYANSLQTSPFDILNDAMSTQTGSTTFQAKLSAISGSYYQLSKDLSKIQVPATFAATYVDMVNTYYALSVDVNNMRFYWSDPVRGFLGLSNYQKDSLHQIDLLKSTASYFKTNAILFSNTEAGHAWSSLIQ